MNQPDYTTKAEDQEAWHRERAEISAREEAAETAEDAAEEIERLRRQVEVFVDRLGTLLSLQDDDKAEIERLRQVVRDAGRHSKELQDILGPDLVRRAWDIIPEDQAQVYRDAATGEYRTITEQTKTTVLLLALIDSARLSHKLSEALS